MARGGNVGDQHSAARDWYRRPPPSQVPAARQCQLCIAWYRPRVARLLVCVHCEAFLNLCSMKSYGLASGQLALPFPLFPRRQRRARHTISESDLRDLWCPADVG